MDRSPGVDMIDFHNKSICKIGSLYLDGKYSYIYFVKYVIIRDHRGCLKVQQVQQTLTMANNKDTLLDGLVCFSVGQHEPSIGRCLHRLFLVLLSPVGQH